VAEAPTLEPVPKPEPIADQKDDDYVAEEEEDDDDEEDEVESEEEEDEEVDEEKADGVAKVMAAATKKTAAKKKKGKAKETAGKEGIGDKAVEAAGRLLKHDPESGVDGWKKGEPVPYLFLANVFENISETTKRLEIAEMLTNAFRTVIVTNPGDLLAAVYLASNTIAPQHEGVDLGIGDATLVKILAAARAVRSSPRAVASSPRLSVRVRVRAPPALCVSSRTFACMYRRRPCPALSWKRLRRKWKRPVQTPRRASVATERRCLSRTRALCTSSRASTGPATMLNATPPRA
jgi:hypothetical protein